MLSSARVELQRPTGQSTNVLLLQDQDLVARALGMDDADTLMAAVADAARARGLSNSAEAAAARRASDGSTAGSAPATRVTSPS